MITALTTFKNATTSLILIAYFICTTYSNVAISEEDSAVYPIVRVNPIYPPDMLKAKQEGWVRVQFDINQQGAVENPYIIGSQPEKVFDREAIRAILKFKFKPKMINGNPVKVTATQLIEFTLSNEQSYDSGKSLSYYRNNELRYELNWLREKKIYQNTLEVKDLSRGGNLIKKIKLPDSKFRPGYLAQSDGGKYLFYYQNISNKKGRILIYDKANLEQLHAIKTPSLTFTTYKQREHAFFATIPNSNKLLAFMGHSRKPKLYEIDGTTGLIQAKVTFKKNTLLLSGSKVNYLWAQQINPNAHITTGRYNKVMDNSLQIIKSDTFETIREIKLNQQLVSVKIWNDIIHMTYDYNNHQPRYRVMMLNLKSNQFYDDFYSSRMPEIRLVNMDPEKLLLVGQSTGDDKYLKISTLHNSSLQDLSNKALNIKYNHIDFYKDVDNNFTMNTYGENAFASINLNDTQNFNYIKLPFDVASGVFSQAHKRGYLTAQNGSEVALINLEENRFVASDHTGSIEKKIGKAIVLTLFYAVTIPNGIFAIPIGAFDNTDNILYLNHSQTRLFALNKKTSDVTSFDASDLSDKHIVDTGKDTFQLLQAIYEPNLPVVAIGNQKVTFMNPTDGRMIKQISYDEPLDISYNFSLTYRKGDVIKTVSLAYLPDNK